MRYRFLLFDLDRTLLDFDRDMTAAFRQLYGDCGFEKEIPYSREMLDRYEACNNRWWAKFEAKECTKPQLYRERFVDFLWETGLSGDPEEINDRYFRLLGTHGTPYPGALDMVKTLAQNAQVYVVTNGNQDAAQQRISRSGLSPLIRDYFVSEAVGYAKPDPRYFHYVFSRIPGFQRDMAVVIGDSLSSDIKGAENAGVDSIWYAPQNVPAPPETSAHYTYRAKSFGEIMEILTNV